MRWDRTGWDEMRWDGNETASSVHEDEEQEQGQGKHALAPPRSIQLAHGLGDLDGKEEGEKVADAKPAAPGPDGLAHVAPVLALLAHALDELEERRLLPGLPLQHGGGEDLVQDVAVLDVHLG